MRIFAWIRIRIRIKTLRVLNTAEFLLILCRNHLKGHLSIFYRRLDGGELGGGDAGPSLLQHRVEGGEGTASNDAGMYSVIHTLLY